jgi:hemolysin-activating ACP:hemolysin acyltransferase
MFQTSLPASRPLKDFPGGPWLFAAERLSLALQVILRRGCYLDYPIAPIKAWLYSAAQVQQLHIFAGKDKRMLGNMTWAWFSEKTEAHLTHGAKSVLC